MAWTPGSTIDGQLHKVNKVSKEVMASVQRVLKHLHPPQLGQLSERILQIEQKRSGIDAERKTLDDKVGSMGEKHDSKIYEVLSLEEQARDIAEKLRLAKTELEALDEMQAEHVKEGAALEKQEMGVQDDEADVMSVMQEILQHAELMSNMSFARRVELVDG